MKSGSSLMWRAAASMLAMLAMSTACVSQASSEPQAAPVAAQPPKAGAVTLTLLGTGGGPGGRKERSGIATLLEVGGNRYLIDAGEGVSRQLAMAGVQDTQVPIVFFTHLHDDHYAGLTALATFAYTLRAKGLTLIGPAGTADLRDALAAMLQVSANMRIVENRLPMTPDQFLAAREFGDNPVYADEHVKVIADDNHHFRFGAESPAATNRSYALRFEAGGKVIVFTGDTGPDARVDALAKGADVLIAEMASYKDRTMVPPQIVKHMDEEHLSPTEVGKLAARAGVKTLVLSHIGIVGEDDLAEIRKHFSGEIVLGADLVKITL
jgi:ribonuclease BN (tRNA processing enzyme)